MGNKLTFPRSITNPHIPGEKDEPEVEVTNPKPKLNHVCLGYIFGPYKVSRITHQTPHKSLMIFQLNFTLIFPLT